MLAILLFFITITPSLGKERTLNKVIPQPHIVSDNETLSKHIARFLKRAHESDHRWNNINAVFPSNRSPIRSFEHIPLNKELPSKL